jgi:predicted type IV restriction endonuclease
MKTDGYNIARDLLNTFDKKDMNEANTRHKIIDELLHNVLHWPKKLVDCERYIKPGFSDYILLKNNAPFFLIEAKKEGIYFSFPITFNFKKNFEHMKVKQLLSDTNIEDTMMQARSYCMKTEIIIEFAAITNGHEWIIFKTYERGKDWRELNAFIIKNLNYFSDDYTHAISNLGFTAITENNSLKKLLRKTDEKERVLFYPKEKINAFNEKVEFNLLYKRLEPIMKKFFRTFKQDNKKFLENCYIYDREYETNSDGVHQVLKDALSPYFNHLGVEDFVENEDGGLFGEQVSKSTKKMDSDVIVLFGGKGVGKSTFLRKLLFYTPPEFVANNSVVVYINLLDTSENKKSVEDEIWSQVIRILDTDKLLESSRDLLLAELFYDKYEVAKKQDLFGLEPTSLDYNKELNQLVKEWKNNTKFCAEQLATYQHKKNKGIIIAIDNTDQFNSEVQDLSLTIAQELAKKLNCLTIISMREERYYKSTIHGTLDAYANSGFHITSPLPKEVFLKRINYVRKIIEENPKLIFNEDIDSEEKKNLLRVFDMFENEFTRYPTSPLNDFLTACAHGDIRFALKLFRAFTGSGYTNINEIVYSETTWKLKIHQVLKPIMIPYRYFYDEGQSSIPNVFQIRSQSKGSHFTCLRILRKISFNLDTNRTVYFSVAELMDYFIQQFDMKEDFENNLSMLLEYRLIESDNRLDEYSKDVDKIKITTYGHYVLNDMSKLFTYLELVCTDCGVFDETTANELYIISNNEYRYFKAYDKQSRLEQRLAKVDVFLTYLIEEEKLESDKYNLVFDESTSFSKNFKSYFNKEKIYILDNAKKNIARNKKEPNIKKLDRNGFRVLN